MKLLAHDFSLENPIRHAVQVDVTCLTVVKNYMAIATGLIISTIELV